MKQPLRNLVRNAEIILKERGNPNARNEAFYLLQKYIPCTRGDLLMGKELDIDPQLIDRYMADIAKRTEGVPLQYLLGKWEFYGLEFMTLPDVLIPRGETEMLVDFALPRLRETEHPRVLDLCCGSGCIGITLGKSVPDAQVTLFDISAAAIDAAGKNAALHGLKPDIVQGDLLSGRYFPANSFDMVLCNPPYIKTDDLPALSDEVQNEPVTALDGGVDGLTFYRALRDTWADVLRAGGYLIVEAGYDTAEDAAKLFENGAFTDVTVHNDLAGLPRMITAIYRKEAANL